MAHSADQIFDSSAFERSVIRVLLNDVWYEIAPVGESSNDRISPDSVGNLPIDAPLHVISACNPGFREQDDVNETRHRRLELRLEELGIDFVPAVGSSPDGAWVEVSWGTFGLDRDAICRLGREFGQVAVFELESEAGGTCRVRVLRCSDGEVESDGSYSVIGQPLGSRHMY